MDSVQNYEKGTPQYKSHFGLFLLIFSYNFHFQGNPFFFRNFLSPPFIWLEICVIT
jgi:hypothetical protein